MRYQNFIISILMFSGVMIGLGLYFGSIQRVYDVGGEVNATSFGEYERYLNSTNKTMSKMQERTAGFVNKPVYDITKYYDAALLFLGVMVVMGDFVGIGASFSSDILTMFPFDVPMWFILMVAVTLFGIIILTIAAIALKREEL